MFIMFNYSLVLLFLSYSYSSKTQKNLISDIFSTQPEVTFNSLSLNENDVIVKSPKVDLSEELSSLNVQQYYNKLKPNSIRILHDLSSEIEKLRHFNIESYTTKDVKINYDSGLHIRNPYNNIVASFSDEADALYQNPFIYVPLITIYLVSMPIFAYLMYYGRRMSKESISSTCSFLAFFLTFGAFRNFKFVILISLLSSLIAHKLALKPLKKFKLNIIGIKHEPIGWVIMIVMYSIILSNIIYKMINNVVRLTLFYPLYMAIVPMVILVILITKVPTYYAQNSIFCLLSTYIIFSGLSYFNDVIVYNCWTKLEIIGLDLFQFFNNDILGFNQMIFLIVITIIKLTFTSK